MDCLMVALTIMFLWVTHCTCHETLLSLLGRRCLGCVFLSRPCYRAEACTAQCVYTCMHRRRPSQNLRLRLWDKRSASEVELEPEDAGSGHLSSPVSSKAAGLSIRSSLVHVSCRCRLRGVPTGLDDYQFSQLIMVWGALGPLVMVRLLFALIPL